MEDNDPLDVLVSADVATSMGCMVEVHPVGLPAMTDDHAPDTKILAVPDRNPPYDQLHTIDQIFPHVLTEVEHFFTIYKELAGKKTRLERWQGPSEALLAIMQSRKRHLDVKEDARQEEATKIST